MFPRRADNQVISTGARRVAWPRGLSLVDLLIAMVITSVLLVVLGGLTMAVQTAREHSEGLEEATMQGRSALDRVRFMVSHAGVYQLEDQPTVLGLSVVNHQWSGDDLPDVLVVWSGGREGGMAAAGLQQRLPQINELIIYTVDPNNPARLVEMAYPGVFGDIDFRDAGFQDTILSLVRSTNAESALLCDRIRMSRLAGSQSDGLDSAGVGNIRFDLEVTPSDAVLSATTPGTGDWINLLWAQGIVSSDSGLRQANVRMELQIERRGATTTGTDSVSSAIPFFGSVSYRYAYQP